VKLPLAEPEADALRLELGRWDGYVSSALLVVESVRACARYGAEYADQAEAGLSGIALLPLDASIVEAAARLEPRDLRSLDALHLSTALSIGKDLGIVIGYDDRLLRAAAQYDLPTASPR
jgi:uncharacterized protein